MKKITCHVCRGTGKLAVSKSTNKERVDVLRMAAKDMQRKGLTIRQIMKALGYKSPSAIFYLLKT